jgi:hypothetical protein
MTPLVGLIIGVVLFSASFYYITDTAMKTPRETSRAEEASLSATAVMIGEALMNKGSGWFTGAAPFCSGSDEDTARFAPDGVLPAGGGGIGAVDGQGKPTGRFGLGAENCGQTLVDAGTANLVSFNKLANIAKALDTSAVANNGLADYPEAHRSLGLDRTQTDFHLRTWPVLDSIQQLMQTSDFDPNMKPLYIGDYEANTGCKEPMPWVNDEIRYVYTLSAPGNFQKELMWPAPTGLADGPFCNQGGAYPNALPKTVNGDVLPDDALATGRPLKDRLCPGGTYGLSLTTVLVIGSNGNTNDYNGASGNPKTCDPANNNAWPEMQNMIRDWVKAGGTLLVLGRGMAGGQNQWLDAFTKAPGCVPQSGTVNELSSGETPGVPDPSVPILNVPNDLDPTAYLHNTKWNQGAGAGGPLPAGLFTRVVTSGPSGDILLTSVANNPCVFGTGRVILTGWRPHALTTDQTTVCKTDPQPVPATCPSLMLMHNLMTITLRSLFIDYGPPLPEKATVVSAVRIVSAFDPDPTLQKIVSAQLEIYVFKGGS